MEDSRKGHTRRVPPGVNVPRRSGKKCVAPQGSRSSTSSLCHKAVRLLYLFSMLRAQSRYDLGSLLCLSLVGLELDVLTKLGAGSGERAISIDPPQNFEPIDAERTRPERSEPLGEVGFQRESTSDMTSHSFKEARIARTAENGALPCSPFTIQ
ncbi:hypothetical protein EDD16DRAFT_1561146 [Pisolithus croceorrhizus]|nr:hypothetical protein EDD16DRAFT_1561146 [Pisolithus croceorrhizus]